MNFRVDARANADLLAVLRWYARHRRQSVVPRLWHSWRAGLTSIQANPQAFGFDPDSPSGAEVRAYVLPRYDSVIRYQITAAEVVVISFASGRRRPRHWQGRTLP